MKKIILTVAAVFALGFANAQDKKESNEGFAKGDVFVTGAFTVSSAKTGDSKDNTFEFAPRISFFVTENIALGAKVGFGSDKETTGSVTTLDKSSTALGVFGRYYFTPASKFSLFANLGLDMTSAKNKLANVTEKDMTFGLGAGMNYHLTNHFSLETMVGVLSYNSCDNGGNGAQKTNTFNFGGDWRAVSFGVNYKF